MVQIDRTLKQRGNERVRTLGAVAPTNNLTINGGKASFTYGRTFNFAVIYVADFGGSR